MTGAEHYKQAERLLEHVSDDDTGIVASSGAVATIAAAQVHATLALAAATAAAAEGVGVLVSGYGWEPATKEDDR